MQNKHLTTALLALILLLGAGLRLARLDTIPPGLTHDEADHGLDAAGVLEGDRPIYFTVGYGREPLYDYVTSLTMLAVGKTFMASRLTAVGFGMLEVLLVYAIVNRWSGNRWLGLAAAAGIAVSFWPVSTSRQALRSITLPVMYLASVWCMLRGVEWDEAQTTPRLKPGHWGWFITAGVLLGAMLYTYLAARIMWAVIPCLAIGLLITRRGALRAMWGRLSTVLAIMAAVAAPLFIYLQRNPTAEVRLSQLSSPLEALTAGDPLPLLTNMLDGAAMLTFSGDDLWLYNIPHRPLLNPLMGVLFYVGLIVAVASVFISYTRSSREPRTTFRMASLNLFMVGTLLAGISPALVTGAGASNVRVIGAQPALYYFPALATIWLAERLYHWRGRQAQQSVGVIFASILTITAVWGAHDYFVRWAQARDVRVAYHTTLVETLRYIEQNPQGENVALSSITPGPFHDAAVGEMIVQHDDIRFYWFDGRSALVFPVDGATTYFFSELAAPHPYFTPLEPIQTLTLRENDFNRTVDIVADLQRPRPNTLVESDIAVGTALLFNGYTIQEQTSPTRTLTVATYWSIHSVPTEELVIFTQALDANGNVIAQRDYLGYPTTSWYVGDTFIQVHTLTLPVDTEYKLITGVYSLPDIQRLPVSYDGSTQGDVIPLSQEDENR